MLPAALALIIIGLAFTFYAVMLGDIDILIDAVGFLLVFNGVNALKRANQDLFKLSNKLCFLLVPITVAQLFLLLGLPYVIITAARALFEAFFYLAMANSMSKVLHEKQPAFSVAVKAVFLLCGFGSLVCVATVYWAPELYVVFAQTVMHVFYILLLCVLGLLFLLMPLAATKAKNSNKRNKKSKKEENVVLNDKLSVSQETEEAIL